MFINCSVLARIQFSQTWNLSKKITRLDFRENCGYFCWKKSSVYFSIDCLVLFCRNWNKYVYIQMFLRKSVEICCFLQKIAQLEKIYTTSGGCDKFQVWVQPVTSLGVLNALFLARKWAWLIDWLYCGQAGNQGWKEFQQRGVHTCLVPPKPNMAVAGRCSRQTRGYCMFSCALKLG